MASPSPMSWRDVYDLVTDSSNNILSRMDDGFAAVEKVTSSHENRLSQLEALNTVEKAAEEARATILAEAEAARIQNSRRTDRYLSGTRGLIAVALAVLAFLLQIGDRFSIF